jgi:gas vesicle protein
MDKNEDTRSEGSNLLPIVLGFMAGAVSGAAVALLLAPASGRDTRAQIGGVYRKSTERVARIPGALESAGKAARVAFAEAQAEDLEAKDIVAPSPPNGR